MVTKQHYVAIAEIIDRNTRILDFPVKGVTHRAWYLERWEIVTELANYFVADNPRFDRQKFLEACGAVESEGVE